MVIVILANMCYCVSVVNILSVTPSNLHHSISGRLSQGKNLLSHVCGFTLFFGKRVCEMNRKKNKDVVVYLPITPAEFELIQGCIQEAVYSHKRSERCREYSDSSDSFVLRMEVLADSLRSRYADVMDDIKAGVEGNYL